MNFGRARAAVVVRASWKRLHTPLINMFSSRAKHGLHCLMLFTVIGAFEVFTGGIKLWDDVTLEINPWVRYGYLWTIVLYLLRLLTFLPLPQVRIFTFKAFAESFVLEDWWVW